MIDTKNIAEGQTPSHLNYSALRLLQHLFILYFFKQIYMLFYDHNGQTSVINIRFASSTTNSKSLRTRQSFIQLVPSGTVPKVLDMYKFSSLHSTLER